MRKLITALLRDKGKTFALTKRVTSDKKGSAINH